MTTQPGSEGSDRPDTGARDVPARDDAKVDRRPDTAGYPSAEDAGAAVADEPAVPADDRDRAGYPDAEQAPAPD